MNPEVIAYTGAEIFDGTGRRSGMALLVREGVVVEIVSGQAIPGECRVEALDGGLIAPGFVDVQVNGGGGKMFNNSPDVETLETICRAHLTFGTTSLLPTLITDTAENTARAAAAIRAALDEQVPGVAGLHLEGPHLSLARKGAHDPALIREMNEADCRALEQLAAELPSLLVTVAPESVSGAQISRLSAAGITVSLGHTDADFATANDAMSDGAQCVTHLFNAMSQLGNRAPGMVGAALENGAVWAGLIADGHHVDKATMRVALRAKQGPGQIFLVTDAMATIGTDMREFTLNGRRIMRRDGRLTLADNTLAGADLDMISAVRFMVAQLGVPTEEALRMAGLYPAQLLGRSDEIGRLGPGTRADFVLLDDDLGIEGVWQGGTRRI